MNRQESIPNTFGIEATADRYLVVEEEGQLRLLLSEGTLRQAPLLVVGAGSNIVFTRHYPDTVLHMANKGIRCVGEDGDDIYVEAAAGEVWDELVQHSIDQGWHGLENLSAIPGTVGAAPVQNVGAYGLEAKDVIHSVRTYEIATGRERTFRCEECQFGYRSSIFKTDLSKQFIVAAVTFKLHRTFTPNIGYKAISEALTARGIAAPSARQLADIITEVRWSKLPRPEETGSAGSFFKNPVVSKSQYCQLVERYPDLVAFAVGDSYKLAAGWLIDKAGWKGRSLGRCGVYEKQALVLVNRGGCSGDEVSALANAIEKDIEEKFGVRLEKEAIMV